MTITQSEQVNSAPAEPTVELVQMTPERANALLEKNTNNRKLKRKLVDELTRAMSVGDYQFNGDAIRVGADGRLLDGQHRLLALVQSGKTLQMLVISGLQTEAQVTMDTGAKRTFADHLKLVGEKNNVCLASIIRQFAIYELEYGKDSWSGNYRLSIPELMRVLERNPKIRDSASESSTIYSAGFKLSHMSTGVAHRVLHDIDRSDADWFFTRLRTGTQLFDNGRTQPLLKLRQYANSKKTGEHRAGYYNLAAVFKTWNAYRDGREVATILPRFGGANPERFPWPI